MSSIVNKIVDAVHTDKSHTTGAHAEGTHGPHNSRLANAADPRIDSDRDGSHHLGGPAPTTHGPHSSNMANKLDPRVDSDHDGSTTLGSGTTGGYTHGENYTHAGSRGTGGGFMDRTGMTGPAHGTAGPHNSNMANKLDPRVDSDRDGSTTLGGSGHHGSGGIGGGFMDRTGMTGPAHGTAEPHNSNMANKLDPRVDSDRDGSTTLGSTGHRGTAAFASNQGNTFGTTNLTGPTHGSGGATFSGGPGPAPNTAGPHRSDIANKLDPRVDSDMDGSRKIGGTGGIAHPRT